jgi:heme/copper-type cytochrome/quinol oxidase subunit 4
MDQLPQYVSFVFIALTVFSVWMFFRSTGRNKGAITIVLFVALVQAILSQQGFYMKMDGMPPRILTMLLPTVFIILYAFYSTRGKEFIKRINMERYTYLHTVRIGVEIVLLWLFMARLMPGSMTFEGRNFDILSGITAPFIAYFGYKKGKIGKKGLLAWNVICLLLVLQVVITGILSAPTAFQQLSFDQPNIGITYFPFVWLPAIIVPLVVFGHLVAIQRLIRS